VTAREGDDRGRHERCDAAAAAALLRECLGGEARDVQPLAAGIFSRACAGTVDNRRYVVRLSDAPHAAEGFAKEAYAARTFGSPHLPIPRVIAAGQTAGGWYAISEYAPGARMDTLPVDARRAVLPALLDTLDAIGRADVSASRGYGAWHADGNADYPTWRAFLAAIAEDHADGFLRSWHALFRESFLERDLFDAVYRRMLYVSERLPEVRGLVHNDYWFINVIAEGERVTGVIDWANALYGDPLYDVARLSWGSTWPGWWYEDGAALLRSRYGALPGYDLRQVVYSYHVALDDLRYFAKAGLRAQYDFFRQRLLQLLDAPDPP
jgi:hygromycin-B 4-O-kinase